MIGVRHQPQHILRQGLSQAGLKLVIFLPQSPCKCHLARQSIWVYVDDFLAQISHGQYLWPHSSNLGTTRWAFWDQAQALSRGLWSFILFSRAGDKPRALDMLSECSTAELWPWHFLFCSLFLLFPLPWPFKRHRFSRELAWCRILGYIFISDRTRTRARAGAKANVEKGTMYKGHCCVQQRTAEGGIVMALC